MGRACFAGSGVTGAGCKRVVMDYPRPRSSGRFESICVLLVSFFRGLRFGRCGCRVGGLKSLIRWLAGGWANNGEPTSRSPVPGRGHLFQQGSPPSPPWCVRPGAFFSPSRPSPALPLSRFRLLRRRTQKRRPLSRPPVATEFGRGPTSRASFGKTWSRWGLLYAGR